MKRESVLYGIIGLLAGLLIMGIIAVTAVNNNHTGMMRMMGMDTETEQTEERGQGHSQMSMDDMTAELADKTGDEFDRDFLAMMIAHHQGAVDMAKQAQRQAKHDEIKQMAEAIISAQSVEISQMESWQQLWGYSAVDASEHNH